MAKGVKTKGIKTKGIKIIALALVMASISVEAVLQRHLEGGRRIGRHEYWGGGRWRNGYWGGVYPGGSTTIINIGTNPDDEDDVAL